MAAVPLENREASRGCWPRTLVPPTKPIPNVYGMAFGGQNIRFTVAEGVLTVVAVE